MLQLLWCPENFFVQCGYLSWRLTSLNTDAHEIAIVGMSADWPRDCPALSHSKVQCQDLLSDSQCQKGSAMSTGCYINHAALGTETQAVSGLHTFICTLQNSIVGLTWGQSGHDCASLLHSLVALHPGTGSCKGVLHSHDKDKQGHVNVHSQMQNSWFSAVHFTVAYSCCTFLRRKKGKGQTL